MSRGIRQGCPISAMLYIFVAEILALKLKKNNNLIGFQVKNMKEIKYLQYADDITLTLKDTSSLNKALQTAEIFCSHAGSKINIGKSECIMGKLKDKYETLEGIKVTNKAVRCLGIHIGHDKEQCNELNWLKTYNDIEKLFESWKRRKLTIFGKTCVVNNLAVSKLIYTASILPLTENEYIQKVNYRTIFNFIWNKRDRIKRNTLIGKIEDGGIGVIDIELKLKSLKASWVKRLPDKSCILNEVINAFLRDVNLNLNYILSTSERKINDFTIINHLHKFYQEIFCCFHNCKKTSKYFYDV